MRDWGLLPQDVQRLVQQKEWDSASRLRERMLGQRDFPMRVALKVPTGPQALCQVDHFHRFINQWRQWPQANQVEWTQRQYREMGRHDVPLALTLDSMQALIEFLGPKAVARSARWEQLMTPILEFDSRMYPVLVKHLLYLEKLNVDDAMLIADLLPQLHKDIGRDSYMRALPLKSVDTKFLETHFSLIAELLDVHFEAEVVGAGGLMTWLGCLDIPRAWLLVRPLCAHSQESMCGLPILQLPAQALRDRPLPAKNILVVENTQTGYGLPLLKDTIAVFGGGANVSWMDAQWLSEKNIAYWGDLDTWGLSFLSDARRRQSRLHALMMNKQTLHKFRQSMCQEATPCEQIPSNLLADEIELFEELRQGVYGGTRLEQERLSPDYIATQLLKWGG